MGENEAKARRSRGRPAQYLDAADRQAASRERQAMVALRGQAAAALTDRPTLPFIKLLVDRALDQAADREGMRAELLAYLAGAGGAPTA